YHTYPHDIEDTLTPATDDTYDHFVDPHGLFEFDERDLDPARVFQYQAVRKIRFAASYFHRPVDLCFYYTFFLIKKEDSTQLSSSSTNISGTQNSICCLRFVNSPGSMPPNSPSIFNCISTSGVTLISFAWA